MTKSPETCNVNRLKRKSCCCGATLKLPCLCMIKGLNCSNKYPLCPCYKLFRAQTRKNV